MLQHIWKHQTRGVNRFINEFKHLKCIFIFYLKYELTSKRIIQFILQNSHHKFEEIQGVWREGEIHYISVTRWNGTESQTFKNTRCKTRYMPIYMYVYESKRDCELIFRNKQKIRKYIHVSTLVLEEIWIELYLLCFYNVFIGLFMRDFYNFMEEVTSGKIDQEMKDRTLRAFQLAEDIHRIIMPKSNFWIKCNGNIHACTCSFVFMLNLANWIDLHFIRTERNCACTTSIFIKTIHVVLFIIEF